MAVKTLENLVLRGVAVLVKDALTVETRRGLGYHGVVEPMVPISIRSPKPANPQANARLRQFPEQDSLADTAAKRAGRLDCQAGSPFHRGRRWSSAWRGSEASSFGLARAAG